MATAIENTGSGLARWQQAIDQSSRGIGAGSYASMLRGVEISLSSRLGRWMQAISAVADGDTTRACILFDILRAANGEISLSSSFGRWAVQVSARFCAANPPIPPLGF
jgi:hypothetical protein